MDNHFNPGYMPSYSQGGAQHPPLGSFGSLPNPAHQQDSPSHTTLPPLQNQNGGGYQFGSLSYGHGGSQSQTPTTPHTPASSSMSSNNSGAVAHMTPSYPQPPGSMLPPSSFNPPYGISQSMPYPTSTTTSLPPTSSIGGLPAIRPMPPSGLPSLSSSGQLSQPAFMQNEEAPTHVVGSQGRRGILPSAPGRPNPPAQGSAQSSKSMIPQKDQDGKFPCPHCNKTYLHAKHLKRHLLRHTGDRPYMCHLCKDTFSRSDILKRHFQKCSIRRGNPTGANHLAHQRRGTGNGNRLSMSQQDGPIGLAGLQEVSGSSYGGGMNTSPVVNGEMSTRSSRANSMISPGTMSHRNSIAGLGIMGSNSNNEHMGSATAMQQGMPPYTLPSVTSAGSMPSGYGFSAPQMNGGAYNNQAQPMSFLGQQSSRFDGNHSNSPHQHVSNGEDWNRMFSQGGQDGFIGSQPASEQ